MRLDWKFLVMLVVTLLGVGVPVWLWQYDLHAKSLAVRVVSSVDLHTPQASLLPGLELTLNGEKIDAPALTTIELLNDGSKPIPSADFEGPLELVVANEAKALEAKVATTEPASLSVMLETEPRVVRVKPLLLNPNDKITINILTSGKNPNIAPRARISGVSDVKMETVASSTKSIKKAIFPGIASLAGLMIYFFLGGAAIRGARYAVLTRPVIYTIGLVIGLLAGLAAALMLKILELDPGWSDLPVFLMSFMVIGWGVMYFSRKWYWSKQPTI